MFNSVLPLCPPVEGITLLVIFFLAVTAALVMSSELSVYIQNLSGI